jgi:hypothetical protein
MPPLKFERNANKQEQTPRFNFDETYAKFNDPESGLIF